MRYPGGQEDTDADGGQPWIEGEEFHWIDEGGNEHRAPTVEDVKRHAPMRELPPEKYSIAENGTVTQGDFAAAYATQLGIGETLVIEDGSLLSGDMTPAPDGVEFSIIEYGTPDSDVADVIYQADGTERKISSLNTEMEAGSEAIHMVGVDNGHFHDNGVLSQKIYVSFKVYAV